MSRDELRPVYERIVARTERTESGCLIWTGSPRTEYGQVMHRGKRLGVHRVVYE